MGPEAGLQLADFDFELPDNRIALRPSEPRDNARLLDMTGGAPVDRVVKDLDQVLRPGDILVFNDTKVIPARLFGVRRRDDKAVAVEATLIERLGPSSWRSLMRPGKRLRVGDEIGFVRPAQPDEIALTATVLGKAADGEVDLGFDRSGPALDAAIRANGRMPLPPYIAAKRPADARDLEDYQTLYAAREGSVAAPTAGLHFTPHVLRLLEARGVGAAFLTLHVGAGTFLPVRTADIADHKMHSEWGEISADTAQRLNEARKTGGRLVAVGTTSARLLETSARTSGEVTAFSGATDIFIRPGFEFKVVDLLLTNFHLPRSTLLMLLAAFAGKACMDLGYQHALREDYRFFSYGDASLWARACA